MSSALLKNQFVRLTLTLGLGVCIGLSVEWPNKDTMTADMLDNQPVTKPITQTQRVKPRVDAMSSGPRIITPERARSRNSIGRTPRTIIRRFAKDYEKRPMIFTDFNDLAEAYEAIRIMNPQETIIALDELSRFNEDGLPEYPQSCNLRTMLLKQLPEERMSGKE